MPTAHSIMKPLYDRLRSSGLDKKYIQQAVLPDWWEDKLASNSSNFLSAQMSVARFLGVPMSTLRDPEAELVVDQKVRLKRSKNVELSDVSGAIAAATHSAKITAQLVSSRLPFTGMRKALEVRTQLLNVEGCAAPNLESLVRYCWEHGVAVVHITKLPSKSRAIDGLATFIGERPVIVLCSGRNSPAWLAFHLAHELGHIMCGHVKRGSAPSVDIKFDVASKEAQEVEADQFAFQVLTGTPEPKVAAKRSFNAVALASEAQRIGAAHNIDVGTVALIYGYAQNRMAVANAAIKELGVNSGAHEIIASAYRRHIELSEIPEEYGRYLAATTSVFGASAVNEKS